MRIELPHPALVLLVGPTSSGKSTFAAQHFRPTEIVSSDRCRALVADDENDQSATEAAFEVLHLLVDKRLERQRLTVVDATNVRRRSRGGLLALARHHSLPAVAIVFDLPPELCEARRSARADRDAGPEVLERQREQLHRSLDGLVQEGFDAVWLLRSADDVAAVTIVRVPLPPDRRREHGPFDVVGDVHGCADELEALLARLGYAPDDAGVWRHPAGRRLAFVGDLVDRGPRIPDVLRLVMRGVAAGAALCVPGNHDDKLLRHLRGRRVQITHGLEQTLAQLIAETPAFHDAVASFLERLPSHLLLDGGSLVVAHAGLRRDLQGREGKRVRDYALFGETTGGTDEWGLPVRLDWAARYQARPLVVYGHTPVAEPRWLNHTVNIDTGCVFGGKLTALRYPELETVSETARRQYAVSKRPFPVLAPEPYVSEAPASW